MKITPFGSMGWIPIQNRHTCCYCLEYNDCLILLDAGTGIARFSDPIQAALLQKYDKVYVLLSHYHLDHAAGLIFLPYFFKEKEVHFAGPGKTIYGKGVKEILTLLTSPPYFARPIANFPMAVHFHDLGIGSKVIDGLGIETVLQEHSDPSLGIKIEGSVCYCTDTTGSESTIAFAKGCRLLLHEAWFDTAEYRELSRQAPSSPAAQKALKSHSHVDWVAHAAAEAGVDVLMLIHLNPAYSTERLAAMEKHAQTIFPNSFLAKEGEATAF
jgi:ribonuclease BN (tRNA processing enzyme)